MTISPNNIENNKCTIINILTAPLHIMSTMINLSEDDWFTTDQEMKLEFKSL